MKKTIKILLLALIITSITPLSLARANDNELKIKTIENIKYNNKTDIIKPKDIKEIDKVREEESYTYEEILEDQLKLNLITNQQYKELLNKNNNKFPKNYLLKSSGNYSNIKYQKFSFEEYTFNSGAFGYFEHVLKPIIYVGLDFDYKGIPKKIVSAEEPHIYTGDGSKCIFAGKIFYKLENYKSIYLGVYGDVYSTGTTTVSGGAKIGIGSSSSVSISISHSDNFLRNIDFDRRKVLATPY